jgi:hypothetical protein
MINLDRDLPLGARGPTWRDQIYDPSPVLTWTGIHRTSRVLVDSLAGEQPRGRVLMVFGTDTRSNSARLCRRITPNQQLQIRGSHG